MPLWALKLDRQLSTLQIAAVLHSACGHGVLGHGVLARHQKQQATVAAGLEQLITKADVLQVVDRVKAVQTSSAESSAQRQARRQDQLLTGLGS